MVIRDTQGLQILDGLALTGHLHGEVDRGDLNHLDGFVGVYLRFAQPELKVDFIQSGAAVQTLGAKRLFLPLDCLLSVANLGLSKHHLQHF